MPRLSSDPELTRLLVIELTRHSAQLDQTSSQRDADALDSMRRTVHALKGSAGLAGEPELASAMQRIERRLATGDNAAVGDLVKMVRDAIRRLSAGAAALDAGWPVPPLDLSLEAVGIDKEFRPLYIAELTERLANIDEVMHASGDPIDAVASVFRQIHTMKGAASAVGDEPMAWFCHGLEERLGGGSPSRAIALTALREVALYRGILGLLLEEPEAALATLRGSPPRPFLASRSLPAADEEPRPTSDGTGLVRVSAQAVDRLIDHVGTIAVARERVAARVIRATIQARSLRRLRSELLDTLRVLGPPKPWGAASSVLRRLERGAQTLYALSDELEMVAEHLEESDQALRESTASAKQILSEMRQTSMGGMFSRLSASALAEARRAGRLVAIRTFGAEERVDRVLAEHLAEPLLQLARNAMAHGIETPDEREALGKPRQATLTFSARKLANRLVVTVSDDGAGVDIGEVRARAVDSGFVTQAFAEAADDEALLELLFLPGFSTKVQNPDVLAGRGIGLDITLASIRKLGGSIRLSSRPRWGFEARVDVQVETGVAKVLWVTAGNEEYALPAMLVLCVRLSEEADAGRTPHLASCLEAEHSGRAALVVVVEVGLETSSTISVGVDTVGIAEDVLVRELSPLLRGIGPFAGAVVRGDGSLRLALDPHALAPRVRALGRLPESRLGPSPKVRPVGGAV